MKSILLLGACLAAVPAIAAEAPPSAWFDKSAEEVSALLAGVCADRNAMVIEQDNFHIVCSRTEDGFKGALAQVIMGNRYSTTPETKVRFAILKLPQGVRVIASQWVETQMAFGQVRRVELNNRKNNATMHDLLASIGGMETPPAAQETPAPTP